MRVSQSWLADLIGAGVPPVDETAEAFVRVGLEIEDVHRPPQLTGPLVVGRVLEFEVVEGLKKPIRWCRVDVGEEQPRGIICGATNFAAGDLVVVALPGAVLPGPFPITARKTYGHISDGMIASARELGIGSDHAGILVLPPGTGEPGDDALPLLGLDDPVIELNITPASPMGPESSVMSRSSGSSLRSTSSRVTSVSPALARRTTIGPDTRAAS